MRINNSVKIGPIGLCFGLALLAFNASADCVRKPFWSDSLACVWTSPTVTNATASVFVNNHNGTWIAWLYPTAFYLEPLEMKDNGSNCEVGALKLSGSYKDEDIHLSISVDQTISGAFITNVDRTETFSGKCRRISKSAYTLQAEPNEIPEAKLIIKNKLPD